MVWRMAPRAAPAVGLPASCHQRVPQQQVHQPPGGGGYVSDVLGGCWRLGAPGPVMGRPDAAVAIAAHAPRPAHPDHARADYPA